MVNSENDTTNFIFFILFLSSILDFIGNIIPSDRPIKLYDGRITYNDGYKLRDLFWRRNFPKEYSTAVKLYNQENYKKALQVLERMINREIVNNDVYKIAISSYISTGSFEKAKVLNDKFLLLGKADSNDYCNAGLLYSRIGDIDKAIEYYDKSLEMDATNKYALNNKGYMYNTIDNFAEALEIFNRAIELDNAYAYSYNNRGLSKIKLGEIEDGIADIKHSISLNPDNSYCYLHLGIYHLDKKEYKEALDLFEKAKKMDKTTYKVDEYIGLAKQQLE